MEDHTAINPSIRRTVYFSGHVQGVGFRYTTHTLARDFQVSGFVRNLPDGRVELVAEGEADEIDRFVTRLESVMERHIRDVKSNDAPATGQFKAFNIER